MKKLALDKATATLAHYARELNGKPLVITEQGQPIAALNPVAGMDMETIAVSTNAKFLEIIERSRRREKNEGGLSIEEVRQRLDMKNDNSRKKTSPRKAKRRVS